jgi:hypothetical protein
VDEAELHCRHFLACRFFWHDDKRGYSLSSLIITVAPEVGDDYPFLEPRVFLYLQLFGAPGDYILRLRLVKIDLTDYGEEVEQIVEERGPWRIQVSGDEFVESCVFELKGGLGIQEPGVYDLGIWIDGEDALLASERILAREI